MYGFIFLVLNTLLHNSVAVILESHSKVEFQILRFRTAVGHLQIVQRWTICYYSRCFRN